MRLDKFLTVTGTATRSESKKAARAGAVTVNGVTVKDTSVQINEETDTITFRGAAVIYKRFTYIMMNKPSGYISSTEDPHKKTVLELLPENLRRLGLFPCGRLDIDTTGLLILTNNGQLAHAPFAEISRCKNILFHLFSAHFARADDKARKRR